MPDIVAVLRASTSDFTTKLQAARGEIKETEETGSSSFSKLGSIGKTALLGIGAAAVTVGAAAVDFGDKLEASQASLQASLKAAGISWDSVKDSVNRTGQAAQHYGFTQAQVDSALSQGIISTQNYAEAHKILSVAIEVAAVKHVSLQQAMLAVTKASQGQSRALKQLGIDLPVVQSNALKVKQAQDALSAAQLTALSSLRQYPDAIDAASTHHAAYEQALIKVAGAQHKLTEEQGAGNQILDALSKRLGGQAAAAADTFAGRIAAAKAEGENLTAQLGLRLLPLLEQLVTVVMNVVNWFIQHKAAAAALGIVIGGALTAAIGVYIAGLVAAGVASVAAFGWLEAIIVAVVAVGAGIVLLATHWHEVWTDIKNWVDDGYQFIKAHFELLMAIPVIGWMLALAVNWKTVWEGIQAAIQVAWSIIGPIFNVIKSAGIDVVQAAVLVFQTVWNTAWAAVQAAISAAKDVVNVVSSGISFAIGAIETVINALKATWDDVWGALTTAVQTMWNIVKPIFDAISSAAHGVADAVGAVKGAIGGIAGGISGAASTLTGGLLAGGGPASAGVPYIVGEAGPELFIPSSSGVVVPNDILSAAQSSGVGGSALGASSGGGPQQIVLNIDGQTFARLILPSLQTQAVLHQRTTPLPVFGVPNLTY